MKDFKEILEIIENSMDNVIQQAFGASLKELREHTGVTQKELAQATKVPRQSISVYERGETAPTITQAYRIALFFNLTVDDFISYGLNLPKEFSEGDFESIIAKYDAENRG